MNAPGCITMIVIGIALLALIAQCAPDDDPDTDTGGSTASTTSEPSSDPTPTDDAPERYIPDLEACERLKWLVPTARAVAVARRYAPLPTGEDDTYPSAHVHLAHGHLDAGHDAAWRNPGRIEWRCHLLLAAKRLDRVADMLDAEGDDARRKLYEGQADDYRDEAEAVAAPSRWTSAPPPDLAETDDKPPDLAQTDDAQANASPEPSTCDAAGTQLVAYARDIASLGGVTIGDWSRDHLDAANAHLLAARSAAAAGSDDWRCHLHRAADRYDRHADDMRDTRPWRAAEFTANAIQLRSLAGATDWAAASALLDDEPP